MISFLVLGFLMGATHALEADHLAAIGAMSISRPTSQRGLVMRGISWGLGHTITLFLMSLAVLLLGFILTDRDAALLEFAVGLMLVGLGLNILWRMRRKRVHFHVHNHDEGVPHIHAHSHQGSQSRHSDDNHAHSHAGLSLRALAVGLIHGLAGSSSLLALAFASTQDISLVLGYVVFFGFGSIGGMALLTYAVSWPIRFLGEKAEARVGWLYKLSSLAACLITVGIGIELMYTSGMNF